MVSILTWVLTDGLSAVEAACQEAIEHGVSSAVILNILARSHDPFHSLGAEARARPV